MPLYCKLKCANKIEFDFMVIIDLLAFCKVIDCICTYDFLLMIWMSVHQFGIVVGVDKHFIAII